RTFYAMPIFTDKLNSLALACSLLITEREIIRQQEVSVVAVKVYRNQLLRKEYYTSVEGWIPSMDFISYEDVSPDTLSDN
ncbi:MAG: hypothetical protein AAF223_08450, partial [Bacteroidota bacterium]